MAWMPVPGLTLTEPAGQVMVDCGPTTGRLDDGLGLGDGLEL
jgi:hypothetical protein